MYVGEALESRSLGMGEYVAEVDQDLSEDDRRPSIPRGVQVEVEGA